MTVTTVKTCLAPIHGVPKAYRRGCRCPETYEAIRPIWAAASRARLAANGGFHVTDPYIDETAVEAAVKGQRVRLTWAERQDAYLRLEQQGMSAAQIARRLHVTPRTIQRRRSATRHARTGDVK